MKRIYLLLISLLVLVVGCQKEENVFNTDLIKSQFSAIVVPTDQEIQVVVPSEPTLKSANDNPNQPVLRVRVYELDQKTYQVSETEVLKCWKYLEKLGNVIKRSGTLIKSFKVEKGNIDLNSYQVSYVVDGPFDVEMSIMNYGSQINQVHLFLRSNNGEQDDFYINSNNGSFMVSPIANAMWQAEVSYWSQTNGEQTYSSELFDCYGAREIALKLNLKKDNTIAVLEIPKGITENASLVRIFDANGNYVEYRLLYDESLSDILSFRVPFEPTGFEIWSDYGSIWYQTTLIGVTIPDNLRVFGIK